ncbi:hypothetical protein BVI2075_480042 [Burkholderia vietnamiensis]|nr:hypothetical protein BVI2075_480042 [Burkholderia vietnamiensis]
MISQSVTYLRYGVSLRNGRERGIRANVTPACFDLFRLLARTPRSLVCRWFSALQHQNAQRWHGTCIKCHVPQ